MMRAWIFGLALLVTAGCHSPHVRQRGSGPPPGAFVAPPAPQPFAGAPLPVAPGAVPAGAAVPFPQVPQNPGPPGVTPSGPTQFPIVPPVPTPWANGGQPGAGGKIEANWQPAEARSPFDGRVLLAPPEPIVGDAKDTQKKLYPPQGDSKQPATSLPGGIAQFTQVTPKISAGLRPALEDGLDWLQAKSYRTVLHVRLPGENEDADRKEAERRGLKYQSLEVSPNLVTKETVDDFFKLLRDPDRQPVFVYDRDGALAGGLWYLWLRVIEEMPDDVARIRARSLGLREDREGAHRDMWQSVQKYLAELKNN